jgi:uncharacterized protein (DUF952 family)
MIFHITHKSDWERALQVRLYMADSLSSQGFIHCSTAEQVLQTAHRFYLGQPHLMLLCIEESLVKAPIQYENLEGGSEQFPHIYGALNLDAVLKVVDLTPGPNGTFQMPMV